MYCKIANSIDFEFLKNHTNKYILNKFKILEAEKSNPYYEKISMQVPSLVFLNILNDYQRRNFDDLPFTIIFLLFHRLRIQQLGMVMVKISRN